MSASGTRLSVRINGKLRRKLADLSRASGRSESDLVREALERHLRDAEPPLTCYELARRIGLIGSASGLPPDLSTNPRHMEGFGKK